MRLTEHFSLAELIRSEYGARHGIENVPTDALFPNLKVLAEGLERARAILGRPVRISSGYRCPDINRAVGGSPASYHMRALAADITVDDMTPFEVSSMLDAHRDQIGFDKIILEYRAWTHIQFPPKGDAPRLASYTINDNRAGYVPGLIA